MYCIDSVGFMQSENATYSRVNCDNILSSSFICRYFSYSNRIRQLLQTGLNVTRIVIVLVKNIKNWKGRAAVVKQKNIINVRTFGSRWWMFLPGHQSFINGRFIKCIQRNKSLYLIMKSGDFVNHCMKIRSFSLQGMAFFFM